MLNFQVWTFKFSRKCLWDNSAVKIQYDINTAVSKDVMSVCFKHAKQLTIKTHFLLRIKNKDIGRLGFDTPKQAIQAWIKAKMIK